MLFLIMDVLASFGFPVDVCIIIIIIIMILIIQLVESRFVSLPFWFKRLVDLFVRGNGHFGGLFFCFLGVVGWIFVHDW